MCAKGNKHMNSIFQFHELSTAMWNDESHMHKVYEYNVTRFFKLLILFKFLGAEAYPSVWGHHNTFLLLHHYNKAYLNIYLTCLYILLHCS